MPETPTYLPDNYLEPIEDAIARKKAVTEERKSKLNPMQALFVNHFFESNLDITEAAKRTGVKVETARGWVEAETGPVSELIGQRLQQMAERSMVTVDTIVQGLYEEATRMPVDLEDKTVSHAARVSAWSHLARFKGMFDKGGGKSAPKITVNIDTGSDNISIEGAM